MIVFHFALHHPTIYSSTMTHPQLLEAIATRTSTDGWTAAFLSEIIDYFVIFTPVTKRIDAIV
jgi:hypothetical protein